MTQRSIAVIGAGINGLTTACVLSKAGHNVTVLERNARPGGAVQSHQQDGFLAEGGPNSFQVTTLEQLLFLGELGLRDRLLTPKPEAQNRYILRNGQITALPSGPGSLLSTRAFSLRGKLGLLTEPFAKPAPANVEESVAEFFKRRLGKEVLDWAVDPFVSGIYAGKPSALSLRHAFPKLHELEQYGSLLKGAIAAAKARKQSGEYRFKPLMASFPNGLGELVDALASKLRPSLYTGVSIESLSSSGQMWKLSWRSDETSCSGEFDAVVIATPSHSIPFDAFPEQLKAATSCLAEIQHPPVTTWTLGFRASEVSHALDGFGLLFPSREKRASLGILFNSSLFAGRAPEGHVTLTAFLGGARNPRLAECQPEEQLEALEPDLALLGIRAKPVFKRATRWAKSIPQYNIGHQRFIDTANRVEKAFPNLYLTGNWRSGIALGNAVSAGFETARKIEQALNNP